MPRLLPLAVVVLLAFVLPAYAGEIREEDDVLVLDESNFRRAVNKYKNIMVEFYAPWCGHCKKLAPEYAKAASTLKADGIRIAKIDATESKGIASSFGVQGYPSLKLFRAGKVTDYSGQRTEKAIVDWIRKKLGPPAKLLASAADLDAFKAVDDVVVVGVFPSETTSEAKAFKAVADQTDVINFGISTSGEVASALGVKAPAVVVFTEFETPRVDMTEKITQASLKKFVFANMFPAVVPLTTDYAARVLLTPVTDQLVVFVDEDMEEYNDVLDAAKEVADAVKGRNVLVMHAGKDSKGDVARNALGINKDKLPTAGFIRLGKDDMLKFFYDRPALDGESLLGFVEDVLAGKIESRLKTEEEPADNDSRPVKMVVGSNFESVVLDNSKDVLLKLYAPWCGHCKAMAPTYEKLGELFNSIPSVVIGKMDATANEVKHPRGSASSYPTLRFFPAGAKDKPVDYKGDRTLANMTAFIQEYAAVKFALPVASDRAAEL